MRNLPPTVVTVSLDSLGEYSKTRWVGSFQVKCILTHADRFTKARLYADLMPSKEHLVEEDDRLRAEVVSQLHVRVVSGPDWWQATREGQLMADLDPLVDLLRMCQEAASDWTKRLEETASFGNGNVVSTSTKS